jgi:TPR repeat protein
MKYLLALTICLFSSLSQAEKCTTAELVKLDDITNCAKHGDRIAQYILGEVYFQGKEVPKNYKKAFEWKAKAARQGDKDAQNSLGFYYFNGWGTKKDHVLAYMWWSLSIVNNEEPITRKNLDDLEQELSAADLARAQKMASDWLVSHR